MSRNGFDAWPPTPRTDASSALQPPWVFPGRACAPAWNEPTKATPLGVAPPRQARTHRHRVRMTTTPEPGRLPSARLRPHGRSRPDCAHCYTCTFQPRTLSLATNRPGPVKGAAVASNYPSRRHDPCGSRRHYGEDASHRCLQSTDDTSTLRTVRLPASPLQALRPASCAHPRPEPRASPGWSIA
jgi:hypothetical protein